MIFWSLSKFELNKTTFIFHCFLGGTKGKKFKKTIDGLGRDFQFFPLVFKVFYTPVSFWLLTHESHDLSQAETKIIVVTSWANSVKMVRFEKIIILSENSQFAQIITEIIFVSAWDKSRDSWVNSQELKQM